VAVIDGAAGFTGVADVVEGIRMERPTESSPLDRHLPAYHFHERHATTITASPEAVDRALRNVTSAEVPVVGLLFSLRTLPARLLGQRFRSGGKLPARTPILHAMRRSGFVLLEDRPQQHLVAGTIGKFWQASGGTVRLPDAASFHSFSDLGYARAVIDFRLLTSPHRLGQVRLTTETRIHVADPAARRRFGLYWRVIYPGSALIRLLWLRAIKRRAEATGQ
jgi:hypothetical protein